MKINRYSLIFISLLLLFSCDKETEGISRITYYVDLELKGEPVEFVSLGGTYIEPGWTALQEGEDVSDKVTVTGNVNTSSAGLYTLNYLVNNADGYPKTASRQIVVSDPTPSPLESGFYKVSKASNRTSYGSGPGSSGHPNYSSEPVILVYQVSPGKFYTSDFLGGYYDKGAGYGPSYAMTGHFTLNEDMSITLDDSFIAGWGDGLDDVVNGSYAPATKTLTYTAQYVESYDFNVIATKQ
jgi:hypothetical protein